MQKTVAFRTLIAAIALGVSGDVLLHGVPFGAGASIWVVAVLIVVLAFLGTSRPQPLASMLGPASGIVIAATGLIYRDSPILMAVDIVLLPLCFALLALGPRGVRLVAAGAVDYVAGAGLTALQMIPGSLLFALGDVSWSGGQSGRGRRSLGVIRGLLIAVPLLLFFGALFMSADLAFEKIVHDAFAIDLPRTIGHVVLTIFLTGLTGGFLRSLLRGAELRLPERPEALRGGGLEINTALAAIDVLFASFVAVQFRYLFGGASLIHLDPKLTYAEYARHGFFELVAVAAAVIPILLAASWFLEGAEPRVQSTFRSLAVAQVLMVFVIIASAWRRMMLYQAQYGMTEQRLYTSAFMLWLAAVLFWLCVTVLSGRRPRFMIGAFVSGLTAVVALQVLNPDDLIVRVNVGRAATNQTSLDTSYATSLSTDSVPALLSGMQSVPAVRPCIARHLLSLAGEWDGDWRTWNHSRVEAHQLVAAAKPELMRVAGPCAPAPSVERR